MRPSNKLKLIVTEAAGHSDLVWLGIKASSGAVITNLQFAGEDHRKIAGARKIFRSLAADPEMRDAVARLLILTSDVTKKPESIEILYAHLGEMRGIVERAVEAC